MTRFWLGGYGAGMDGSADGIGLLAGDAQSATTLAYRGAVAAAPSPSWLAEHPRLDVVYAALDGDAAVQAFARTGEATLAPLGDRVRVGENVCHLAVAPSGKSLVASCYGDGKVVRTVPQQTGDRPGVGVRVDRLPDGDDSLCAFLIGSLRAAPDTSARERRY